jgi:antitoxin (DNA-binding transcriptional repressor) of toxin-antitoxin stability system
MVTVGVRQLRDGLSDWLDRVQAGEDVVVTSHGRPIAHIIRWGRTGLDELVADGLVTPAQGRARDVVPAPVLADGQVSDLVAEQRR